MHDVNYYELRLDGIAIGTVTYNDLLKLKGTLADMLHRAQAAGPVRIPGWRATTADDILARLLPEDRKVIQVDHLLINPFSMSVESSEKPIHLTPLEFRLLYYLASRPNQMLTREHLLESLWGRTNVIMRTVDVYVRRLREKIEGDPNRPKFLRTARGAGYIFAVSRDTQFAFRNPVPALTSDAVPSWQRLSCELEASNWRS